MSDLRNNRVALVRIPKVPTYADCSGATSTTVHTSGRVDLQFYGLVVSGGAKQIDRVGRCTVAENRASARRG
ncbi:MAG TPA: hypothetical protein VII98_09590 [Solirubrobacteraceae bacterium]